MTNSINEKHLELLQGVINRMAGNSFLLKGWSVTLVAALLALAAGKANPLLVSVALLPVLAFWGLDGYFLAQERLFRKLYERVIAGDSTLDTFSMRTRPVDHGVLVGDHMECHLAILPRRRAACRGLVSWPQRHFGNIIAVCTCVAYDAGD